ncbi:MAG: CIA30 family protein [Proteobacteria bacterium]|nr:CIA30 family protein [Pseudomonadota bacterium]
MTKNICILACLLAVAACTPADEAEGLSETNEPVLSDDALVVDFGLLGETSWYSVNDTVMGGVSDGRIDYTSNEMVFEGTVSTDSNGGFTSVRSPDSVIDLSAFDRLVVRLRSEGQPFSLVLSHNENWYEGQYRHDISNATGDWQTLEFQLDNFQLHAFSGGYPTPTGEWMEPQDREEIYYMELMSKLFEDGPFLLEVDYIAFD